MLIESYVRLLSKFPKPFACQVDFIDFRLWIENSAYPFSYSRYSMAQKKIEIAASMGFDARFDTVEKKGVYFY